MPSNPHVDFEVVTIVDKELNGATTTRKCACPRYNNDFNRSNNMRDLHDAINNQARHIGSYAMVGPLS